MVQYIQKIEVEKRKFVVILLFVAKFRPRDLYPSSTHRKPDSRLFFPYPSLPLSFTRSYTVIHLLLLRLFDFSTMDGQTVNYPQSASVEGMQWNSAVPGGFATHLQYNSADNSVAETQHAAPTAPIGYQAGLEQGQIRCAVL